MNSASVLLLIPPLTQLNTPYPSTAYLTGFLKSKSVEVSQSDFGLEMILKVFSKRGLVSLFDEIEKGNFELDNYNAATLNNRKAYEDTVDEVIAFLQNRRYTLGYRIAARKFLPEGGRFMQLEELDWFFGSIGTQDQARYLCTMYLEDLGDLIQDTVGPQFGFSKYAERIARTASSFDPIEDQLQKPDNYFDRVMLGALAENFTAGAPDLVGLTVPFSGNLYGALKAGQWIKKHHPKTKVALGGGYANTELRDLTDPRVFDYVDYITLDDGEGPIIGLIDFLEGGPKLLKRTFLRENDAVVYVNNLPGGEFKHADIPAPSYEGLNLKGYLSMFDVPNPMHRLWNDGRWNKMTIAHGCYWKKCTFCDVSLDYISRYSPAPAVNLVDKMQEVIAETGETGFHFVDEAAPPLAMRDLAIEILRRGLQVTWWTNIRFEKTFTPDLCRLLAASGCIAVTGGLEVASPRLLELMEKGITIEQVSKVCKGFRDSGILVHAYLMYGFPTQTDQETIDSLEIVRQLFKHNLIQSGFWHQFAMTAHSPVGLNPEKYKVVRTGPEFKGFAQNDLYHDDPTGADHAKYSEGLRAALYNYMHNNGFDFPLAEFFDFDVPRKTIASKHIQRFIKSNEPDWPMKSDVRLCWYQVTAVPISADSMNLVGTHDTVFFHIPEVVRSYFEENKQMLEITSETPVRAKDLIEKWAIDLEMDPEDVVQQPWWIELRNSGMLWLIKSA